MPLVTGEAHHMLQYVPEDGYRLYAYDELCV